MTEAQWAFEFHALQKKENQELELYAQTVKTGARILRDTLIGVLGLNLFVTPMPGDPTPADGETPLFVPAAALFSNHHLLKLVIDQQKDAMDTEKALNDSAFEEFSKKLARGDVGDMDPLLVGPNIVIEKFDQAAMQAAMKMLGIRPRPDDAPAVPHFGKKRGKVLLEADPEDISLGVGASGLQPIELEPGLIVGGDE